MFSRFATPDRARESSKITLAVLTLLCIALSVGLEALRRYQASVSGEAIISITITEADIQSTFIAKPEKRVPAVNNDDTFLEVQVRNVGQTTPLFRQTVRTSSGGAISGLVLTGIRAGTYDVSAKALSYLRRTKTSVALASGGTVDFTDGGTNLLIGGDVNSASGDNVINGLDLTQIISNLTTDTEIYDLNRDTVVNGIDLTNAITNLTQAGDA